MFKKSSYLGGKSSLAKRAFSVQCERAFRTPAVPSSDQTLENFLTIMGLYSDTSEDMPVSKDQLREVEKQLPCTMYQAVQMAIDSPTFNQLISTLQLTMQKAQLLNMSKLASLLTIEIAAQQKNPTPPSSPAAVAHLLEELAKVGVSFEILAGIEDIKFGLIVSGAAQLQTLAEHNVSLNKLLELDYLQLWTLAMPCQPDEHELISSTRQQAIDLLNTCSLNHGCNLKAS